MKAVIFDKDGVLMFTEEIYFSSHKSTLSHFGAKGEYAWDMHRDRSGTSTSERFLFLKKKFDLKMSFDEYFVEYKKRYTESMLRDGLVVPEGVVELIASIKEEGMLVAVATGGARENANMTLEKTNLIGMFDAIVTSSDVARGKPDPEIFLLAAQRLGVVPQECVVIGDAINDVLGAKAAGMKVIAITDKSYIEDPDLVSPDLEVKEFKDITIDMIKSL